MYAEKLNNISPAQVDVEGVGVGVVGTEVTLNVTLSQVIDGVGVGKGTKSQSKYAVKFSVLQLTDEGVGVGQGPDVK